MIAITHPYEVRLAARGLYAMADVSGLRIVCEHGSVWITLDCDPRDIVLEPGEIFRGSDHRRALIYALQTCQLTVGAGAVHTPSKSRIRGAPELALAC